MLSVVWLSYLLVLLVVLRTTATLGRTAVCWIDGELLCFVCVSIYVLCSLMYV